MIRVFLYWNVTALTKLQWICFFLLLFSDLLYGHCTLLCWKHQWASAQFTQANFSGKFNYGIELQGGISSSILSVFFTDKFALSQSDARISVAYNSCQWKTLTKRLMKCPPGLLITSLEHRSILNSKYSRMLQYILEYSKIIKNIWEYILEYLESCSRAVLLSKEERIVENTRQRDNSKTVCNLHILGKAGSFLRPI